MQNLDKRITALEQASYSNTDDVMFIHFVDMGEVDKEIQHITEMGKTGSASPTNQSRH